MPIFWTRSKKIDVVPRDEHASRWVTSRLSSSHFKVQICQPVLSTLYEQSPVERGVHATEGAIDLNHVICEDPGISATTETIDHDEQTPSVVNLLIHLSEWATHIGRRTTTNHRPTSSQMESTREAASRRRQSSLVTLLNVGILTRKPKSEKKALSI